MIEGRGRGEKRIDEQDWFYPQIDRRHAEEAVSSCKTGVFLVRQSKSHQGSFTLTAKGPNGVMNLLIRRVDHGYVLGEFSRDFATVTALVDWHRENEVKVCFLAARVLGSTSK